MPKDRIHHLEAYVLYGVVHCKNNAYGVLINKTIRERADTIVAMGALYATLNRLENKGFLESSWSEPTVVRGGRTKRVYKLTSAGAQILSDYDGRISRIREGWTQAVKGNYFPQLIPEKNSSSLDDALAELKNE